MVGYFIRREQRHKVAVTKIKPDPVCVTKNINLRCTHREKLLLVMLKSGIIQEVQVMRDMKWPSTRRRYAAERTKRVLEFALTILATVAVMQALIYMIPQGGWIYLMNYTAGVIVLTLLAHEKAKRIK